MKISLRRGVDLYLIFGVVALGALGVLFIYSASSYSAELEYGDAFHYVKTQAVALALGLAAMTAVAEFLPLDKLKKYNYVVFGISVILLALVFVPHLGVESYGAKRWLNLGFFTIQPSEYAKFGLIICIAAFESKHGVSRLRDVFHVLATGGVICVLLMLEPNMSITVVVVITIVVMLFVGGVKYRHLALIGLPAVGGGLALIFSEPYRVRRLLAFLNPWESPLDEGYQLIQSYYALGSGGLFGVGLFNSRQKYLFLPFSESDFILSVIGEETGLFGVAVIILLFLLVVTRGVLIAVRAKDRFSCYLAAGITALIAVQSVLNVAVVCGAVPPTGLPLPFVSAGGSSLVAFLLAVGLLLNIDKNSKSEFGALETLDRISTDRTVKGRIKSREIKINR